MSTVIDTLIFYMDANGKYWLSKVIPSPDVTGPREALILPTYYQNKPYNI
jgi:hypothetical protein